MKMLQNPSSSSRGPISVIFTLELHNREARRLGVHRPVRIRFIFLDVHFKRCELRETAGWYMIKLPLGFTLNSDVNKFICYTYDHNGQNITQKELYIYPSFFNVKWFKIYKKK